MITKNMPIVGIITAALLILLGIIGYLLGGDNKSLTAFIPAIPGVLILLFSAISFKESLLKLGMHLAVLFGLLGFLAPLGRLVPTIIKGKFELGLATGSMILMAIICAGFVVLSVKSFIDVRKAKKA